MPSSTGSTGPRAHSVGRDRAGHRLALGPDLLVLGALSLVWFGPITGGLGLALVVGIVLYNTVHKLVSFAPLLMGISRFFLYVIAASAADKAVTGWSIWGGLALAAYVAGLRYFAHEEGKVGLPSWWPVCLLSVPVVLALIMDAGTYREAGRCSRQCSFSGFCGVCAKPSGRRNGIWVARCPDSRRNRPSGLAGCGRCAQRTKRDLPLAIPLVTRVWSSLRL